MKNSYLVIVLALLLSGIMILADNIEFAYAISVTTFPNTSTGETILRYANTVFTTGFLQDTVRVYSESTGTLNTAITCTDCQLLLVSADATNPRVYALKLGLSGVVYELDPTFTFMARSVAYSGNGATIIGDTMYLASQANDRIDSIDLSSGTLTVTTGDNINTGANACDAPVFLDNDGVNLFVACNGVTKYLAGISPATITGGEPEARTNITGIGGFSGVTSDTARDLVIVTSSSGTQPAVVFDWNDALNTFSDETVLSADTDEVNNIHVGIDSANRWYFSTDQGLIIKDAGDETGGYPTIFTLSDIYTPASGAQTSYTFNPLLTYIIDGTDWHRFLTTGIESGTGGTVDDPDTVGGIDCSLPANANILICRLGGDNNFGGIGNATGTGLLNIACNIVFVSCEDTNPQTNGLGLLAFIASLFVIIGMFYYTIGKEAFHMPIFIWIVIVIALSAFFTIAGWIDPIFLILSIIAVVAMAVPKIINITRGNTFGSGSSE